ncbi:MAG: hypothetical protein AB1571_02630 [Nanoarchaeota archaeon]
MEEAFLEKSLRGKSKGMERLSKKGRPERKLAKRMCGMIEFKEG